MEWHRIIDPNDPELDRLAATYKLHPLHIEDCRHRDEIAKIEEQPAYLFVVLKPVEKLQDGTIAISDLDIFAGKDFVITVEEGCHERVRGLLAQLQSKAASLRPDELFHRIADGVVDAYFPILDHFDNTIDQLEDRVLQNVSPDVLSEIFETKRRLIEMRRVLVPTRDAFAHLQRSQQPFIQADMWPYFRDIYDHIARDLDMVEMQRDLVSGCLDIYLSGVANRTNQVMKVLTVLGTLALPSLVISSIYGMNIKGLPAVDSPHAIVMIVSVMIAFISVLLAILKYFGWW